ncbi:MAG: mechanosensitive ion channel [Campylobacteraceae bacterium]|jgi:small-conductance mechanosensitive channel|nr:mechanosensitive ion channel [Campylobacteraceae bacterium]
MSFWLKLLVALVLLFANAEAKPKKQLSDAELAALDQNISSIKSKIAQIEEGLSKSVWYKRYADFTSFGNYKKSIFGELIKVDPLGNVPKVESPFGIFNALSFIKESSVKKDIYESRLLELEKLSEAIDNRARLNRDLAIALELRGDDESAYKLNEKNNEELVALKHLKNEKESFAKSVEAFNEKVQEDSQKLQMDIKYQLMKLLNISLLVLGVIAVSIMAKIAIKKYSVANHERAYLFAKTVNIVTIVLVVLILLFSYINDVGYIVTILGFASAGIAIAMKDWFMSLLGWVAIVLGGAVKVGDRVKITSKEGVDVLGDIIDISLLTITLYEDVSLVSYAKNKRAGRIVFIPNNYIFTHIFLNYSHSGLATVWDNVDIRVTFDSDIDEAIRIAFEVASKHSKVFSKLTERSIRRMRAKYSFGDVNTEPRVFSFIEENGVAISVWYPTNSFSILKTKSAVSKELLAAINASSSVRIAFPTTSVVINEDVRKNG